MFKSSIRNIFYPSVLGVFITLSVHNLYINISGHITLWNDINPLLSFILLLIIPA